MTSTIKSGDLVQVINTTFFVEAFQRETGEMMEISLFRRQLLVVCGIDLKENTVDIELPNDYVVTLSLEDVEVI